jgi:hypothetical protein
MPQTTHDVPPKLLDGLYTLLAEQGRDSLLDEIQRLEKERSSYAWLLGQTQRALDALRAEAAEPF